MNNAYAAAATADGITGYTPKLMSGIAFAESSCAQFQPNTLFGMNGSWPTESPTTPQYAHGSFIGLMQVQIVNIYTPGSMQNAWDWQANGATGVHKFVGYFNEAILYQNDLQSQYAGLGPMATTQLEYIIFMKDSGYSSNWQYFVPQCSGQVNGNQCSGTWSWVVSPNISQQQIDYVEKIRDNPCH